MVNILHGSTIFVVVNKFNKPDKVRDMCKTTKICVKTVVYLPQSSSINFGRESILVQKYGKLTTVNHKP